MKKLGIILLTGIVALASSIIINAVVNYYVPTPKLIRSYKDHLKITDYAEKLKVMEEGRRNEQQYINKQINYRQHIFLIFLIVVSITSFLCFLFFSRVISNGIIIGGSLALLNSFVRGFWALEFQHWILFFGVYTIVIVLGASIRGKVFLKIDSIKSVIRVFIGVVIIVFSLFVFFKYRLVQSLILATLLGWTSDSSSQSLYEHLLIRLASGLMFTLNAFLTYSGISICRNKTSKLTYFFLIIGLIPASMNFYGDYKSYQSAYNKQTRGDTAGAIKVYDNTIRELEGSAHYPSKKTIVNTEEYDNAIRKGGGYAYTPRGELYYSLGDYKKAIEDFRHKNNDGKIPYDNLMMAYLKLNDTESALRVCDEFMQNEPMNERPHQNKAGIYLLQGKIEQVIAEYEKILAIRKQKGSDWDLPYIALANCYAKLGNGAKALEYYNRAIEIANEKIKGPGMPDWARVPNTLVYIFRGLFYYDTGDFDAALNDFNKAIKLQPERSFDQYLYRALALIKKGEYGTAIEGLDAFLSVGDARYQKYAHKIKAFAYKKLGDSEKSKAEITLYNQAKIKLANNDPRQVILDDYLKLSCFPSLVDLEDMKLE